MPLSAQDFTPFAQQVKQANPDLLFVAWAGTTAPAMWRALEQQGAFGVSNKITTGLAERATWSTFGDVAAKIDFLSHYVYTAPKNKVNDFLVNSMRKRSQVPDLFTPDGFVAAQMIVRALDVANGDDVDKMISALEGWSFVGPKGQQNVRKSDHAMIQPMFQVKLVKAANGKFAAEGDRPDQGPVRRPAGAALDDHSLISGIVATSAPILATRNLGLDIGGATIVADVSLEVAAGEFVGIIGPNGAGKTTLFNLLSGLLRPTAGSVELHGRDVTGQPPYRRSRAGLGRTFQVSSVFPLLAVLRERAPRGRGGARRLAPDLAARRVGRARRSSGRDRALDRVGLAGADAVAGGLALARRQAQARAGDAARGPTRT